MNDLEKIYFLAFKGFSPISKLIKFWTRSPYSHIGYLSLDNRVIEAWTSSNPLKIKWHYSNLLNHEIGTIVEFWEKEVSKEKAKKLDQFMQNLAIKNVGYDYLGIFGFVFKNKDSKDKYFCSEGCAEALVKSQIWPKIETHVIHPGYFVNLMKVSGFSKVSTKKL